MDQTLIDAIERCRTEIRADPQHRLSFRARRALLLAMGPLELDSKGYGAELVDGKRRRVLLALAAARRVAPHWARDYETTVCDQLLELIEKYLRSAATREEVRRATDSLQGGLLNDAQGKDQAYLAGRAVAAAGRVAFGDELLTTEAGVTQEELDDPADPDLWDPAFFAAGAEAGGMPWSPGFNATTYHEFWLWYLDQAVPRAWAGLV